MNGPIIFERGDKVYLVGPVAPIEPTTANLEEFAFADVIRQQSPNELLLWLRGQYVEADKPNLNGQLWGSEELAIKSITPRLMPVSVMHNPTQTVGLIADTRLLTPEQNQVPRARIDTALALWKHRYPDVCEEAMHNHATGNLMQSMECLPAWYECLECGHSVVKLPGGAERANWCSHLRAGAVDMAAAITKAPRRLGDVTFTGTGLIFGSRGARGANEKGYLETFREEVAEFHERAQSDKPTRRTRRMETIEIPRTEYDELKLNGMRVTELTARQAGLEETAAKVPELEKQVEKLEVEKKTATDELAAAKTTIGEFEESARSATLSGERLGKLGDGFRAKLPDTIKATLNAQAKTMSDEDWAGRLEELAELTGVKSDEGAPEGAAGAGGGGTFSREEIARAGAGGSNGTGGSSQTPSRTAVSTVLGGLLEGTRPKPPEPAKK